MMARNLLLLALPVAVSLAERPAVPQHISWLYSTNLSTGAEFLGDTLGFTEVENLIQRDRCRIFRSAPASFVGVCNTRAVPECEGDPERPDNVGKITYTLVLNSREEVDDWYNSLEDDQTGRVILGNKPQDSPTWGAYAFNVYDRDWENGLGCYRFEVQYFIDEAFPQPECETL